VFVVGYYIHESLFTCSVTLESIGPIYNFKLRTNVKQNIPRLPVNKIAAQANQTVVSVFSRTSVDNSCMFTEFGFNEINVDFPIAGFEETSDSALGKVWLFMSNEGACVMTGVIGHVRRHVPISGSQCMRE